MKKTIDILNLHETNIYLEYKINNNSTCTVYIQMLYYKWYNAHFVTRQFHKALYVTC